MSGQEQKEQAGATENPEAWRELADTDREDFKEWVSNGTAHRQEVGQKAYGDTFQGDPLTHATEEALDSLFYLWEAFRQRAAHPDTLEEIVQAFGRGGLGGMVFKGGRSIDDAVWEVEAWDIGRPDRRIFHILITEMKENRAL